VQQALGFGTKLVNGSSIEKPFHFPYLNPNHMRTLILTTAAALLLCATSTQAQDKAAPAPAKTTEMKAAPLVDQLAAERSAISQELKNTVGMASEITAQANKLASIGEAADKERLMKVIDGAKGIEGNITEQLNMVAKADASNSAEIFANAKEVNANSLTSLGELKGQLSPEKK